MPWHPLQILFSILFIAITILSFSNTIQKSNHGLKIYKISYLKNEVKSYVSVFYCGRYKLIIYRWLSGNAGVLSNLYSFTLRCIAITIARKWMLLFALRVRLRHRHLYINKVKVEIIKAHHPPLSRYRHHLKFLIYRFQIIDFLDLFLPNKFNRIT